MTSAPSIYSSFLPSDLLSPVHQVAPLSDHDHSQSQVRRSVWSGRGLAPVSDHLVGYSFFFFFSRRTASCRACPLPPPLLLRLLL